MKLMGRQCHRCQCHDDPMIPNSSQRAREKRMWQRNWIDEYEDSQSVIDRACPKGGPDCQCDKAVQDDTSN